MLVSRELEQAMQGNILGTRTLSLFYATDFADQLENRIIPALRSGFIVVADRYIYTLMARAIVRGVEPAWIQDVYSIALVPDAVFYLAVSPKILVERNLRKHAVLDYWESGMDMRRSSNMYGNFIDYQRQIQKEFKVMQEHYGFESINGNRSPRAILPDSIERASDKSDQRLLRLMTKCVGAALRGQEEHGLVRSAQGPGEYSLWEVAR